ncbi:hydroxymethylglutaryl-CoA synthase 1, partial [Trichonephila clavata]
PYTPIGSLEDLFPGTWYLEHVDDKHRRTYQQVKKSCIQRNGLLSKMNVMNCESTKVAEEFCKVSATSICLPENVQLV